MSRLNDQRKQQLTSIANPPPGKAGYTTWRKAQDLVARGWAVTADGLPLRPGSLLMLVDDPPPQPSRPLSVGTDYEGAERVVPMSHGDGLGGTAYSSDHATATNPQGVWYLKHLLARERPLFCLSVLDNLRAEGA